MDRRKTNTLDGFEAKALWFVIGVVVTLILLWLANTASNGRLVQNFFGAPLPTAEYDPFAID